MTRQQTTKPRCHADGTVTYWSVYEQQWRTAYRVPDQELAAMQEQERRRVQAHQGQAQDRAGQEAR